MRSVPYLNANASTHYFAAAPDSNKINQQITLTPILLFNANFDFTSAYATTGR